MSQQPKPLPRSVSASTRLGPLPVRIYGDGAPNILAVHGLLFDGGLWNEVADRLGQYATVIVPDLPFGAHRTPVPDRSRLTPPHVVEAFVDILDALDIPTAMLLGNDTGGALCQIAASTFPERFTSLALTSSDAFNNFPPLIFQPVARLSHLPGIARGVVSAFTWPPMLSRPSAINLLAASPIDRDLVLDWLQPAATDRMIRGDLIAWMRSFRTRYTVAAAERLRSYPGQAVLAWSRRDRLFPAAHAERLARILPNARLIWIDGALTLSPIDQPDAVAAAILTLVREIDVAA